ncbi:glycosyltransferase family 2 protein [Candidatus Roizmanbacteria bacterium]|nr:glycosyltransferase family 2 protein [Candidatus Roizmanbacteria bacterium]
MINSSFTLSVIIVSYNTAQVTEDCLKSVYQSLPDTSIYEIIVIDNASTDQSLDMLRSFKKRYTNFVLVENKENIGFGKANNQGVKIARGKYILLLNSDTLILHNAVIKLLEFYQKNEEHVHFLAPKLRNKDLSPQPSCGPFYTPAIVFGALFLKGDYWGLTRESPTKFRRVDWVSGACILTTRKHYSKVGGFDEQIFMYMEEIDLLYRAKKMGLDTYIYPEAQIIHLGSASSNGKSYPIIQVYKGFIYFYKKHYPPLSMFLLKVMLQFKALSAIAIGRILRNAYLINTYEKAYRIAQMD